MLTSDIWGDILRFVVRAVPRQHNNGKEIQKDFGKVVDRCLADMVILKPAAKNESFSRQKSF